MSQPANYRTDLIELDRPLPVGMAEFEEFSNRILSLAGKYADEDSMKFALASIIIHADASKGSLPDSYFLERLRKSAANQIASQVFQDVKARQAAAQAAAQQPVEDTTTSEVVSSDQKN